MRRRSSNGSRGRVEAGFTLVEVIVVLAVVLLLSGIAVPLISGYVDDSKRARAASEVKMLAGAVAAFYKDLGIYPTRNSSGINNQMYCLMTGESKPQANGLIRGHSFQSWAQSTRGDLLDMGGLPRTMISLHHHTTIM